MGSEVFLISKSNWTQQEEMAEMPAVQRCEGRLIERVCTRRVLEARKNN